MTSELDPAPSAVAAAFSARVVGAGPPVALVHGSATDAEAWAIQRRTLARSCRLLLYTRRADDGITVGDHAADLADLIERHGLAPCTVVGSSFGAVVALELARAWPARVRGAVLCEPPLPPGPARAFLAARGIAPPAAGDLDAFLARFDHVYRERGGPAAAAVFLRAVLGDEAYARLPRRVRERAAALHRQIRADAAALAAYDLDYAALAAVACPVLLVGGDRSPAYFAPALAALEAALPNVRRVTLTGAGHMMHADAPRAFDAAVAEFAREHA